MTFPDPLRTPDEFVKYLKAETFNCYLTIFNHFLSRPVESDGQLNESDVVWWVNEMDKLLVHFLPYSLSQADHLTTIVGETFSDASG
jgi:hypothetical protein